MKVLIVEDNPRVSSFLVRGLKAEGYLALLAEDGQKAIQMAVSEMPEIIILDRMLPLMDGMEVLQEIRARKLNSRILILSALSQVSDKIMGLKMGADDYMAKPFEFEELLARIAALSRRTEKTEVQKIYTYKELTLNMDTLEVRRKEKLISLTPKELAILELLISSPKKVFSRERILSNVWDSTEDPMTNIVDVYIKKLRSKIDEGFGESYIKTFRGIGYSLSSDGDEANT